MASYDNYLYVLGHTADSVVTERIVPLINEVKSLTEKLREQKRKNSELSADIKKQSDKNIRLKNELSAEGW